MTSLSSSETPTLRPTVKPVLSPWRMSESSLMLAMEVIPSPTFESRPSTQMKQVLHAL